MADPAPDDRISPELLADAIRRGMGIRVEPDLFAFILPLLERSVAELRAFIPAPDVEPPLIFVPAPGGERGRS